MKPLSWWSFWRRSTWNLLFDNNWYLKSWFFLILRSCFVCLCVCGKFWSVFFFRWLENTVFSRLNAWRLYNFERFWRSVFFERGVYFKVIFLKSLTILTVNHLWISYETEAYLHFLHLSFYMRSSRSGITQRAFNGHNMNGVDDEFIPYVGFFV